MKNTFSSNKVASFLAIILSVFFVVAVVEAATTISTNIQTDGTLSVTGTSVLTGNVGIGTTTPAATLDVFGSRIQLTHTSNQADGLVLSQTAAGGAGSPRIMFLANGLSTGGNGIYRNPTFGLTFLTGSSPLNTSGVERMVISDGGLLGIGLVAPNALLHVSSTTPGMNLFHVRGGSNNVVIDRNGNLGVGTTTPSTRLHVSSGASATTTVSVGELGLSSSKGCVNMNASDGSASSFYINAAHQMVVEANYCR